MEISDFLKIIDEFPSKHRGGFTPEEVQDLLFLLSDSYDKNSYSSHHTCFVTEDGIPLLGRSDLRRDLREAFKYQNYGTKKRINAR